MHACMHTYIHTRITHTTYTSSITLQVAKGINRNIDVYMFFYRARERERETETETETEKERETASERMQFVKCIGS